jgi:hypothetical protein
MILSESVVHLSAPKRAPSNRLAKEIAPGALFKLASLLNPEQHRYGLVRT